MGGATPSHLWGKLGHMGRSQIPWASCFLGSGQRWLWLAGGKAGVFCSRAQGAFIRPQRESSSRVPGVCEVPMKSHLPDKPVGKCILAVPCRDTYTATHPGARETWRRGLGVPARLLPVDVVGRS